MSNADRPAPRRTHCCWLSHNGFPCRRRSVGRFIVHTDIYLHGCDSTWFAVPLCKVHKKDIKPFRFAEFNTPTNRKRELEAKSEIIKKEI